MRTMGQNILNWDSPGKAELNENHKYQRRRAVFQVIIIGVLW